MTFAFDPSNAAHARALDRLGSEQVAWLVTTGRDGYPHAVPVWFLWRDGRAIIFSQPKTAKAANIRADNRVALHLESGDDGEQLTVLRGIAEISPEPAPAWLPRVEAEYTAKYDEWMQRLGLTTRTMFDSYTAVIEVTPHKLIAS